MTKRRLRKPDGRELILYARGALPDDLGAPAPRDDAAVGASHLRWHPLREEWVIYAGHRQHRTFLPPAAWNPLAPSRDPEQPTEVPPGPWQVAVFENRFPALSAVDGVEEPPRTVVDTAPGVGRCEVVVFTQDPSTSLGALPIERVALVLEVWADRTRELGARGDVAQVMPFENRGVEVGVTLHHPHGQIYGYPFVPPVHARQLAAMRAHHDRTGRGLLADLIARELDDGRRVLHASDDAIGFVPVCARHPYEIWVAPRRAAPTFAELTGPELVAVARALKDALMRLDGLWQRPMPYVLIAYQAPSDDRAHPEAHVHVEIWPAYRMAGRLKYLAGSELGAGVFTADALPEDQAAALRAVEVDRG